LGAIVDWEQSTFLKGVCGRAIRNCLALLQQ
jgi:hypothetical protein